jgi:uncharacterized protein (TIGR03083 family)
VRPHRGACDDGYVPTDRELVDRLDEVWASISDLGSPLTETDWKRPTECPGWSVQDNLAHLSSVEGMLLGAPAPEHELPAELPHVKNDVGRANELFVDSRRSWTGADVLAEFRAVTAARLGVLRGLDDAGFGADSWTPVGPGTVRDALPFRIFDCWVHEQDMRRAVGRPGDLDSRAAAHALGMMTGRMPFIVGKKVGAPEGASVVFALSGPLAQEVVVEMVDGRARTVADAPASPTVSLAMTTESFARLATGRIDPIATRNAGDVAIQGDTGLGERVVDNMNYLF